MSAQTSKNTVRMLKHISVLCFSAVLMGLGIDLFLNAGLGADAITTLVEGISILSGWNVSVCNFLFNITVMIVVALLHRPYVGIGSFLYMLICSVGMRVWSVFIPDASGLSARIICYLTGLLVMTVAIALNTPCDYGKNAYDAFCLLMSERTKLKFATIRMICDAIMLISGILMGGAYGIGTIISIFAIGRIAGFMIPKVRSNPWLRRYMELD